jgi:cobalamin biosynthesis Mg chelatase CobN
LTRADLYDDLAQLEQLPRHVRADVRDGSAKLPRVAQQVWQLLVDAQIHRDLSLDEALPSSDDFDNVILHVDGTSAR